MDFLPLFHKLQGRVVLVVGGGEVALRKARLLSDAGGQLRVVAPEVRDELTALAGEGRVHLRGYESADLQGVALVVAATDDEPLNARISAEAQALGIPVNVVDAPALCSVIFPAIVDRSPLIVAVTSGGDAPVLARLIRAKIETWIPSTYGQLASLAKKFRERVKQLFPDVQQRRVFWEDVFQGQIAESVFAGKLGEGERLLEAKIAGAAPRALGEVYLVGAGPGDPDLLTFRALRLMQQADVVLYDRLVAPAIIELCRRDAERIYVGKRRAEHAVPQEEINQLLVDLAKQGKRVLRLKGGDPFIFGRGGEEIEQLAAEGIPFQVVPGITAASGCAADPPRPCPVGAFRHRPPQGRQHRPALDRSRRARADPGVLHGPGRPAADLPGPDRPRAGCRHPGGAGAAGHHAESASVHRHPGQPAAAGGRA